MSQRDLSPEGVKARMGYPDALKAVGFDDGFDRVDICLVPSINAAPFSVVVQGNCDPKDIVAGYSGVTDCADLDEAEQVFEAHEATYSGALAPTF